MKQIKVVTASGKSVPVGIRKHHWAKRMTLKVNNHGEVTVSIPRRSTYRAAEEFAHKNAAWIQQQTAHRPHRPHEPPTTTQREHARKLITDSVEHWSSQMGVSYERIFIRNQKSRWGSCSSKGNLNFNWRLIELPAELMDYVVVHELAHRVHLNHSPEFYKLISQHLSNHKELQRKLSAIKV